MPPRNRAGVRWIVPAVIALATALAFEPAIHNGFTNWDDPAYVAENHLLRDLSPRGVAAMFGTFVEGNYHPLTIASLALDYHLGQLNPRGYHVTNLVLHVLATGALYWLILLLTGSRAMSAITSLFFGIHPLHVESVAWVSARKDLLYALFYLGACISYVTWVRQGRVRPRYYVGALGLFVLSLLSKGMAATLPVVLILIDFYVEGARPWKKRLLENVPFLILSVGFGVLAIVAQKAGGAIERLTLYPFHERILFACYAVLGYVFKALAPLHLSAYYPYPDRVDGGLPAVFYLAPLLLALCALAVYRTLKRTRGVAFGALFYLVNVVLVLQLLPLGSAMMADRYTYLSAIGIGFVLAEGYRRVGWTGPARRRSMRAAVTVGLVFGAALFLAARARCGVWKDDLTLWSDVIRKYPRAGQAYVSRAIAYEARGEVDRAIADLDEALAIRGDYPLALCNRGILFLAQGELERALADLDRSVALDGSSAVAWNSRGTAHARLGDYAAALSDFSMAIQLKNSFALAYLNRANTHNLLRQFDRALRDYDTYLKAEPGSAQAHYGRGLAAFGLGDVRGAVEEYGRALAIDPRLAPARLARSRALGALGRSDEALRDALDGTPDPPRTGR